MILFNEKNRIFHLMTSHMSYVFGIGEYLQSLYWGGAIAAEDCAELLGANSHSSFDWDTNLEREEYVCHNGRSFVEPCLSVKGKALFLQYISHKIAECKNGVETLEVHLADKCNSIHLTLYYKVFCDFDIISRSATLKNEGETIEISNFQSAALCLPQGENGYLRYLTGKWAGESQIVDAPVETGLFTMQSRRGITGPHFNPSFAISELCGDETKGEVRFGMLAYSGNWKITVEKTIFGNTRITGGMNDYDFAKTLSDGESFSTPEFIFGFAQNGLGEMSRKLHKFQLGQWNIVNAPRRVLYNSWEATTFAVNAQEQKNLAKIASEMGVELFVVDDGWFGARNSDKAGLGDWTVNREKFPNGLDELIKYVNSLKMDFGIWVEPEAVNPDSDLFRKHPDWIYRLDNVEPMQSRNQYVLNISIPEAKIYLTQMLTSLLTEHKITFLKWDMNRAIADLKEISDNEKRCYWRAHVDALYEIWANLKANFPNVEIETCAGGGGRIDLGILRYADQSWASDNTDPYERLFIQEGFSNFYAPKNMMCWVTDTPDDSRKSGRGTLKFKFHSAMCGGLGIGADISKFSLHQVDECAKFVAQYKEIRSTIQSGEIYRLLSPRTSECSAVEYVSDNGNEVVVIAFLHSAKFGNRCPRIKLMGLDENCIYRIDGSEKCFHGSYLMRVGLQLPLKGDFDSELLRLHRQPK